ncbi:MAG TPA: peptidoglycan-binding domain-containing protein [Candidatus Binatia bacterium]|jgi:peptidoglycan hydrolase-like protein with peptidoglycan-binding domain
MRKEFLLTFAVVFVGTLALGSYARAASDAGSGGGSSSFGEQSSGRNAPSSRDTGRGSSSTSSSSGSESVKKVQQALKDKGQDPGPIDGVMGEKTKSALKAYQSANKLKATGMLDSETAKSLGVESASSSSFSDQSSGRNAPSSRDTGRGTSGTGTATTGSDKSGSSSFGDLPSGRNAPSSRDPSTK